jgi:hydroxymethylpyrimidine/phosphomethylpyrimidine kinase
VSYQPVLVIGGHDPNNQAGIVADCLHILGLGGQTRSIITDVTAQNDTGVHYQASVEQQCFKQQLASVLDDNVAAVKIGLLSDDWQISILLDQLTALSLSIPIVLDPVGVASSGGVLNNDINKLAKLQSIITVITYNVPEAEYATGIRITDLDKQILAAQKLISMGWNNIIIKGGHLDNFDDGMVHDLLYLADGSHHWFTNNRIKHTNNIRGTGCRFASALAYHLIAKPDITMATASASLSVHEYILNICT